MAGDWTEPGRINTQVCLLCTGRAGDQSTMYAEIAYGANVSRIDRCFGGRALTPNGDSSICRRMSMSVTSLRA